MASASLLCDRATDAHSAPPGAGYGLAPLPTRRPHPWGGLLTIELNTARPAGLRLDGAVRKGRLRLLARPARPSTAAEEGGSSPASG